MQAPRHQPQPVNAEPLAALDGTRHGFFTRQGGVSGGLYGSLNTGLGSGDDREKVLENRARAAAWLGVAADRLATPYQIHSAEAIILGDIWQPVLQSLQQQVKVKPD